MQAKRTRRKKEEQERRKREREKRKKKVSLYSPSWVAVEREIERGGRGVSRGAGLTGRLLCIEMPATMPREWTGRCKRSAKMK